MHHDQSVCEFDSRLERRLRRKSIGNRRYKQNPCKHSWIDLEDDQDKHMSGLGEHEKIKGQIYKPDDNRADGFYRIGNAIFDDSGDYEDPDYKMFLQNLKQYGNSYAFVGYCNNGEPKELDYEIDDWLPEAPRIVENLAVDRKTKGEKGILREVSIDEEEEISSGLGCKCSSEGDVPSQRALRYQARNDKKGVRETSDDASVARQKSFLEARKASDRIHGRSGMRSGLVLRHLDEDTDSSGEEEYVKFLNPVLDERDCFLEDLLDADEEYNNLLNRFGDRTSGKHNPGPSSDDNQFVGREFSQGNKFDDVDEDYEAFLNLLETAGEDKFSEADTDSDIVVIEKGSHEADADSGVVVIEEGSHVDKNSTPFVSTCPSRVIDLDTYCPHKDSNASRNQFKKDLLEILRKPYDSKEHQFLKKEVECRKPILRDRNLRGKIKTYPSNKLGKSYLDLYSDLAKLIDLSKNDDHKSLNLLRGFFFWLKHVARDGAFQPWDDPSIVEVLPQQ